MATEKPDYQKYIDQKTNVMVGLFPQAVMATLDRVNPPHGEIPSDPSQILDLLEPAAVGPFVAAVKKYVEYQTASKTPSPDRSQRWLQAVAANRALITAIGLETYLQLGKQMTEKVGWYHSTMNYDERGIPVESDSVFYPQSPTTMAAVEVTRGQQMIYNTGWHHSTMNYDERGIPVESDSVFHPQPPTTMAAVEVTRGQ
jgi:hypothetical protein